MRQAIALVVALLGAGCGQEATVSDVDQLDAIAEQYVRLALALGEHDSDYVDAYFGPPEWREQARAEQSGLAEIVAAADTQVAALESLALVDAEFLLELRQDYLLSHLRSLATVARMRDGLTLSYDDESRLVYGFVAPSFPQEHYGGVLEQLNELLPGEGPTHERYLSFRQQFRIPDDRVRDVVRAGLDECRRRTSTHMSLPEGENFSLEFVTGQPWGAYNWYQGKLQGLIQINLDRPKYLGASVSVGCHEGYPGHHAFSALLEKNFLQDRGWIEFSVLPLFSPQGIVFEGSGDLAAAVAFPGAERNRFLRGTILPIAGIQDADLEALERVRDLLQAKRYSGIEAARNYLDGNWSREATADWLTTYGLVAPEGMDAWFGFTERYRAYGINYVLGEDLVTSFVRKENPDGDAEGDWRALEKLLSLPPTPALFNN
jgi:hypothetical protein